MMLKKLIVASYIQKSPDTAEIVYTHNLFFYSSFQNTPGLTTAEMPVASLPYHLYKQSTGA